MHEVIPVARPSFSHIEERYLHDAFKSGYISASGKYVELFEKRFASYHNMKYAVSCQSGTAALHLALLSLHIGRGNEVIIPNYAFQAVQNAVLYCRATPIFAEIDPDTWNIDVERVKSLINSRTKAIICVHTYGNPCDMRPLMALATLHKLHLIEDCAESFGSRYETSLCGTMSTVSCFSFYGNKTITTGQGGMLLTDSEEIAKMATLYKNQAMTQPYEHVDVGYNYRMTNLEAAIGCAQLERASAIIAMKRNITMTYGLAQFSRQIPCEHASPVMWMNAIRSKDAPKLREFLRNRLIETRPAFPPFNPTLPVSQRLASEIVCLPSGPDLSVKETKRIMEALDEYHQANRQDN